MTGYFYLVFMYSLSTKNFKYGVLCHLYTLHMNVLWQCRIMHMYDGNKLTNFGKYLVAP
jgi:hypothetical protein